MLRACILFCFALLLAVCGRAQDFSWAAAAVQSDTSVTQKLQMRRGMCIVTVNISGKNYDFLFDTGAPTVVSEEIRERLSAKEIGTVRVMDALGNGAKVPVINMPELHLSGLGVSGIPALVYENDNPVFSRLEVQGILGSNALQQLSVSVSEQNKTIRFSSLPEVAATEGTVALNLTEDAQGSPFLSLPIAGKPETFLFDSGFEGLADLSSQTGTELQQAVAVRTLQSGNTYTGINGSGAQQVRYIRIASLQFPSAVLSNVSASITGDSRSKIGAALFQLGDVTLDYRNRQFRFAPYGQP